MGAGSGGAPLKGGNRFSDNAPELKRRFPFNSAGYFGKGRRKSTFVRTIESNSPARTAAEFMNLASKSFARVETLPGKGMVYHMRDRGVITYRRFSSSDGSPVVELRVLEIAGVKDQKIHFTRRKK